MDGNTTVSCILGLDFHYLLTGMRRSAPYRVGSFRHEHNRLAFEGANPFVPHIGEIGVGLGLRHALSGKWSAFSVIGIHHRTHDLGGGLARLELTDRDALLLQVRHYVQAERVDSRATLLSQ